MILITGASGSVGKAVLQEAIRKESKVRAMYRSKEEAAKAPSGGEAGLADDSAKQSLRKALNGMTSAYVGGSPIPHPLELTTDILHPRHAAAAMHPHLT